MASVVQYGEYPYTEWPQENGYGFNKVQLVGKNVFKGQATAGHGSWEGQAEEPGYITMDGTLQTLQWKVPGNHRPVRLVIYHEDASGNPNSSNYNLDYYYYETAIHKWRIIASNVANTVTHTEVFGETWEVQGAAYRLTLQGTTGHIHWITPYNQYLSFDEFGGPRQSGRRDQRR